MENADTLEIVRRQFNRQAERFTRWSITRNQEYMQAYFDFCRITSDDTLLDVACGTGEFSLFNAPRIRRVVGVDISEGMLALARVQADEQGVDNVDFVCHDVARLPCQPDSFSVVVSKSAFHHLSDYPATLAEMFRCCRPGGRVSIQDIVAHDSRTVDEFFERMEKLIDPSHHKTLAREFIRDLVIECDLGIRAEFQVEVPLNVAEYIDHASQTEAARSEIRDMLEWGLKHREIAPYFSVRNEALFFRRNVFLILGEKPGAEGRE
jgi:ubiquinone/menaquinone biosynthesis C-methylase UbiE